jgi:FAD/FMN-containing dehydrogenase
MSLMSAGGRVVLNDIHSGLNESEAASVVRVDTPSAVRSELVRAAARGQPVAFAGGHHAMGGQQFCRDGVVLDTRGMNRVLSLDSERGIVDVEAGIQWPELIAHLNAAQRSAGRPWAIAQKQTGADRLTIGGSIAANIHGRGLKMKPFVADIESFMLVDASGQMIRCSRDENAGLFRLATGGYGLFGCIVSARIRLVRRRLLERIVELETIDNAMTRFGERIADGFEYGDFQFATDSSSEDFLFRGIFSCYRPVERANGPPATQAMLSSEDWRKLILLAHADKRLAFELYSQHYLKTSGQLYYSDLHQLSEYEDGYHRRVDEALDASHPGSEMISELYVPRDRLADFMAAASKDFRAHGVNVIYGTVRLIERDDEVFLTWAREPWACIIFNLHADHSPAGIEHTAAAFRRLIDLAVARGGSYFLTYHRWAARAHVEACHPRLVEFLRLKRTYDPDERLQSDWYRHYRAMFAEELDDDVQLKGCAGQA